MTVHRPQYPKLNSARLLVRPDIWAIEHLCFFEWYAYRKARKIFAVSNYAKAHVMANLGLRGDKIEVVYNGIASEFFSVRRENISSDEIKIFTYGRLEPQKGIDVFSNCTEIGISGSGVQVCHKKIALVLTAVLKANHVIHGPQNISNMQTT